MCIVFVLDSFALKHFMHLESNLLCCGIRSSLLMKLIWRFPIFQGDYDPRKTKVLHLSMNPMSLAKEYRVAELKSLKEECEQLRERVRGLEGGAEHEQAGSLRNVPPSQEIAGIFCCWKNTSSHILLRTSAVPS